MLIAIAGILHESNTFAPSPTTLQSFADVAIARGDEIRRVWGEAHHEIGGFIEGTEKAGAQTALTLGAAATPSGPLTRETFESLAGELIDRVLDAKPDGVLLALHGAMVAEHVRDADGETITRLRHALGPDTPIVLTLDLHANVSRRMTDAANATIAYRTYPHVRQRDRGLEAAALLVATVRGDIRPLTVLRKPPLVHNIVKQQTAKGPGAEILAQLDVTAGVDGILSASYAPGFYYADVEEMGPAIIVVADDDEDLATREADRLADLVWERRADLTADLPDPESAVSGALSANLGPVCLLDCGDNIGGGSPGDSTILFHEVVRQGGSGALVILYDPEAVRACELAGINGAVSLRAGGKTDRLHGAPVNISGVVERLSDGHYVETEPRHGGKRFGNQGPTAVVRTDDGNRVVLTTLREAPMSLQQILSLDIDPLAYRLIVVKGTVAPRAAYEPIASEMVAVDTPGVTAASPFQFAYTHRSKPLYPLDQTP